MHSTEWTTASYEVSQKSNPLAYYFIFYLFISIWRFQEWSQLDQIAEK